MTCCSDRRYRRGRGVGDANVQHAQGREDSLYRHQVRRAAVEAVLDAIDNLRWSGQHHRQGIRHAPGPCLPQMGQEVRAIDWQSDRTERSCGRCTPATVTPACSPPSTPSTVTYWSSPRADARGRPGELIGQRKAHLPSDGRQGGVDNAPQATEHAGAEQFQTTCDTCARARRHRRRGSRGRDRARRSGPRRPHLPRDRLPRARGRRLPEVRVLQRRDDTEQCGRLREAAAPARANSTRE